MRDEVIVAGYICLDLLPEIYADPSGGEFRYVPGQLLEVGGTESCCGGAVPNTGLALHRLGHVPRLVGRIGDDPFGGAVRRLIEGVQPGLGRHLIVDPQLYTANTFILSPPGQDRMFMVHTGANAGFTSADLDGTDWDGIRLLHFGYPPLLRESWRHGGEDTRKMLAAARRHGVTTSLDMSLPSPGAEAYGVDWSAWFDRVLPEVDVFLPSLDELAFMLRREIPRDGRGVPGAATLRELADGLLRRGVAVVVIKLGSGGIYVRTTDDAARLRRMGACAPEDWSAWCGREMLSPCLTVRVRGTTGAGDCTIAGFLSGLLRGMSAAGAATLACAVGACNVEAPDAFSGLQDYAAVRQRLDAGWPREDDAVDREQWRPGPDGVWLRRQDLN